MKTRQTSMQVADIAWNWTSNEDGSYGLESINVAASVATAQRLRAVEQQLISIKQLMLSLGADGLHLVLRDMARKIRAREKREAAKRKAARAKAKEARS